MMRICKRSGRILRQTWAVTVYDFQQWQGNVRVILVFALAFILCFLLSDKVVRFAAAHSTTLQIVEPFIWTFGDSDSILLASVLLIFLFADMPFLTPGTPFFLVRTSRKIWLAGQMLYIILAVSLYLLFLLASTAVLCMGSAFTADMWSPTAALLGYSGEGESLSVPALVKTMEMTRPFACLRVICGLILLYTLVLVFLMLLFNLWKGQAAGIVGALAFSLYGFLLDPDRLQSLLQLPDQLAYKTRVLVGWLSPLNHATYSMHSFGYDSLPRLWQTGALFGALLAVLAGLTLQCIRRYPFDFRGTEGL